METPLQSSSSPIRPWFLDPAAIDGGGRLGFVYAPGRTHPGSTSPDWCRDLEADLCALRRDHDVDVLVTLMEPEEMVAMGIEGLPVCARTNGMEWIGFPIPDMDVPASLVEYRALLALMRQRLRAGRVVVAHCLGGLGRSGMVVASALVELGWSAQDAIKAVRSLRPGAIQTVAQERLVRTLAERGLEDEARSGGRRP